MIALDSGDKIRGDASSAAKVDYTLHGVVADVLTQLADGQCSTSEADLYMAPSNGTIVTTIIMVNTHTSAITCNLYLKPNGGTSRRIIPEDMAIGIGHVLTFDGVNLAVTNQQGNVVFYEEGDTAATPSGYAHLMRQADNTLTVPLIDADRHQQVDVVALPADVAAAEDADVGKGVLLQGEYGPTGLRQNLHTDDVGVLKVNEESAAAIASDISHIDEGYAAEGGALGRGVLLQGDDGTDRTNVLVDTAGHLQVDVLSGGGSNDSVATEGAAATKGTQISLDDGTDSHYAQANAAGDLKVTLDSEAVVLGTGSVAIGKLAANSGVDIGDVDVLSLPTLPSGTNAIGKLAANDGVDIGNVDVASHPADTFVAEDGALGKGVLLQGDDGTDRHNVAVNTNGRLQADVYSHPDDTFVSEGGPLGKGVLLQGDDGTDRHNVAVDASGNVQVDVVTQPNTLATWTQVVINISTATTTQLIAASAGHTYTIVTISLTIAAENNLTFKSASTAGTGPMDFGKSGEAHGWQANFWPVGIKCVAGEALNLTTTTTGQVSGIICVLDES